MAKYTAPDAFPFWPEMHSGPQAHFYFGMQNALGAQNAFAFWIGNAPGAPIAFSFWPEIRRAPPIAKRIFILARKCIFR